MAALTWAQAKRVLCCDCQHQDPRTCALHGNYRGAYCECHCHRYMSDAEFAEHIGKERAT